MKLIEGLEPEFISDLQSSSFVGLDTESTGLDYFSETLLLIQFELNGNIYLLDCRKVPANQLAYIFDLINSSGKLVTGHNLKYDLQVIYHNSGILLRNVHDTMYNEVLNFAGIGKPLYSLRELVKTYAGVTLDKDVGKEFLGATEITQEMLVYSALDVKYLRQIWESQVARQRQENTTHIAELENQLLPLVSMMEYDGVLLDKNRWGKLDVKNSQLMEELHSEIISMIMTELNGKLEVGSAYDAFVLLSIPHKNMSKKRREQLEGIKGIEWIKGTLVDEININSYIQLPTILRLMGIEAENSNAKHLSRFKHQHPIIPMVLEYKELVKKNSAFGENFYDYINSTTGRIHPDWHPLKSTGRFGCSGPNLQNILRDKAYRRAFVARNGWKMITLDYSQAEYRLLGAVTGEPNIIIPYQEGYDFHRYTASLVYDVPLEEVSGKQRSRAKNINFSLAYFSTEWGLYHNYGIPVDEGRLLLRAQAREFPRMMHFRDGIGEAIWERKYSKTPHGRIRYFEDRRVFEGDRERKSYKRKVIREGFNLVIQGGVADIIKMAMLDLFNTDKYVYEEDFRILMQEHDELVIEAREEIAEDVGWYAKEVMEQNAVPFFKDVPSVVSKPLIGDSWDKEE